MIPRAHLDGYPVFDMEVEEERKFNHRECPSGADHRGRLSVLRKAPNLWLVYCYNCGDGNAMSLKCSPHDKESVLQQLVAQYAPEAPIIEDVMVNTTRIKELPKDMFTGSGEKWDVWAHERLWEFNTNASTVIRPPYYWGFSPSMNQLITPIYGTNGEELGYQARQAPGVKPKCITTYYEGNNGKPLFYIGKGKSLFIVEDPISALRINVSCDHHVMALLGTHFGDVATGELIKAVSWYGIENIVIWFDDDNAGKEASFKVFRRVSKLFLSPRTKVETYTYLEPKQVVDLKGHLEAWTSRS